MLFRSSVVVSQSRYGLKVSISNLAASVNDTVTGYTPTYGMRVFLIHYGGTTTELTSGSPVAIITPTNGTATAIWTPTQTTTNLGYDALQVNIYLLYDGDNPLLRATFISDLIESNTLLSQTWQLDLHTHIIASGATSNVSFSFGDWNSASGIENVGFTQPDVWSIQTAAFGQANILLFIFYPYISVFGSAAYLLLIMIPTFAIYARYRDTAAVIYFYAIFAAPIGASVWLFIPSWASGLIDVALLLLFAALIWRALR